LQYAAWREKYDKHRGTRDTLRRLLLVAQAKSNALLHACPGIRATVVSSLAESSSFSGTGTQPEEGKPGLTFAEHMDKTHPGSGHEACYLECMDCKHPKSTMWMLMLQELLAKGERSADTVHGWINELEDKEFAQELATIVPKGQNFLPNPFERPVAYEAFTEWLDEKSGAAAMNEAYSRPGKGVQDVELRFPDLLLGSLVCLVLNAYQTPADQCTPDQRAAGECAVDPGFDADRGSGLPADCETLVLRKWGLTDAAGNVRPEFPMELVARLIKSVLNSGISMVSLRIPMTPDTAKQPGNWKTWNAVKERLKKVELHAIINVMGLLTIPVVMPMITEKPGGTTADLAESSSFSGTGTQPDRRMRDRRAKKKTKPSGKSGGGGGGSGGLALPTIQMSTAFALTNLGEQLEAVWNPLPEEISGALALVQSVIPPQLQAAIIISNSDIYPGQAMSGLPSGMAALQSLSSNAKIGAGVTIVVALAPGVIQSFLPDGLPDVVMGFIRFLDSFNYRMMLSPTSLNVAAELKKKNLPFYTVHDTTVEWDDADCNILCQMAHRALGDSPDTYFFIDVSLEWLPSQQMFLKAGIADAQIKLNDWCTLTSISMEIELSAQPIRFEAMLRAKFTLDNPAYEGDRDYTTQPDGSVRFGSGQTYGAEELARLVDRGLLFEGAIGIVYETPKLGATFEFSMGGYYMNAFGAAHLHFGNLQMSVVLTPAPPWIGAMEVGGEICLGTFGACAPCILGGPDSVACGSHNPLLRAAVYAGIGISPSDNYFSGVFNGELSLFGVMRAFELDKHVALPDFLNVIAITPRFGEAAIRVSFALEEKTLDDVQVPGMPGPGSLTIPQGLMVDGRVVFFKGTSLEWGASLKLVISTTSFLIDYEQDPINIAGVFTLTSYYDRSKGPRFYVKAGFPNIAGMAAAAAGPAGDALSGVIRSLGVEIEISGYTEVCSTKPVACVAT